MGKFCAAALSDLQTANRVLFDSVAAGTAVLAGIWLLSFSIATGASFVA
jgi:hypothetical protein